MAGRKAVGDKHRKNTERKKPNAKQLANLRPAWQAGQSGNPKGRPKAVLLSDAYRRKLSEVNPDDPDGRTWAECIASAQVESAAKGRVIAAQEIADRTEGKPRQQIDIDILGMFERAKNDYGIDPASDPILSAIFVAVGAGNAGEKAD